MRLYDPERAQWVMTEAGVDLLLASSPPNVGYLAGYRYYVNDGLPDFLLEDGRAWYTPFVGLPRDTTLESFFAPCSGEEMIVEHKQVWVQDRRPWGPRFQYVGLDLPENHFALSALDAVEKAVHDRGLAKGSIAVEMDFLPAAQFEELKSRLPAARFLDAGPLLWSLRQIKTPEEVARLRKAAAASDAALHTAYSSLREGMTDTGLNRLIDHSYIDSGVRPGWNAVAFGPKGSKVIVATEACLRQGELVRVDTTCRCEWYFSDMSRVGLFGEPSPEARRAVETIFRANRALADAVHPGARCSELYHLGNDIIEDAGYRGLMPEIGHSIGLSCHEPPVLTPWNDQELQPGHVVVIEPTVRILSVGSVNIEDMLLVTEDGNEPLTRLARDPEELVHAAYASPPG